MFVFFHKILEQDRTGMMHHVHKEILSSVARICDASGHVSNKDILRPHHSFLF